MTLVCITQVKLPESVFFQKTRNQNIVKNRPVKITAAKTMIPGNSKGGQTDVVLLFSPGQAKNCHVTSTTAKIKNQNIQVCRRCEQKFVFVAKHIVKKYRYRFVEKIAARNLQAGKFRGINRVNSLG